MVKSDLHQIEKLCVLRLWVKGDITLHFKLVNSTVFFLGGGGLLHKASCFALPGLLFNML